MCAPSRLGEVRYMSLGFSVDQHTLSVDLPVQKNIKKRPWMALYTGAFGGLIGCVFFLISIWAKFIDRKHGGWALLTAR